jgi:hypothetical protein
MCYCIIIAGRFVCSACGGRFVEGMIESLSENVKY